MGNVGFGRFLMDVSRHQEVKYEKDEGKVTRAINSFFFHDLQELSDQVFEVKMCKKRIKCDLAIQIGFFTFTYSKLRMFEFYYHWVDAYLDRQDFQYLEMDTDSAYVVLAGNTIDKLVKPERRADFHINKHQWFPRDNPPQNTAFNKCTPGLFKIEWEGDRFVGLNSKTYCCWGEQETEQPAEGSLSGSAADTEKSVWGEQRFQSDKQPCADLCATSYRF